MIVMLNLYSKEQFNTSKIKEAFEAEAVKQLHAYFHTDEFRKNVIEHTRHCDKINIKSETEAYFNEAKEEWLEAHSKTIFLDQAKIVLKEDFFDILEKLTLPGKQTKKIKGIFKKAINPFLALTGTTSIGAGVLVTFINPPVGIALAIAGSAVGGFFLSRVITDSEKECEKALRNQTKECLRKYIHESKQKDIDICMKTFFEENVMRKIDELSESIRQTKVDVGKCETQEALLKIMENEISTFSKRLKNIKWVG